MARFHVWKDRTVWGELSYHMICGERLLLSFLAKNSIEDIYVTSYRDGRHSVASFHPYGLAADYWWDKNKVSIDRVKLLLGNDYDVVDEGSHIHIEYDPK